MTLRGVEGDATYTYTCVQICACMILKKRTEAVCRDEIELFGNLIDKKNAGASEE